MAGRWYYTQKGEKRGPVSGQQLFDLAAHGDILPTDTVWKDGVEAGVLAVRVRNLFIAGVAAVVATIDDPAKSGTPPDELSGVAADTPKPAEPETYRPTKQAEPTKKGLATAMVGADIVGQDGKYARYRMKCTKCGHKDASCRTIQITNKMTKSGFFCPKCRKRCDVAIQCRL